MPWGYRSSKSSHHRSGGTSAWNTSGETASVRNACAQYDLTEQQVAAADPPIPCQWRSCHGNSYAVVKLSDIAALKRRIANQAAEAKKKKMIEELGEEGYKAKMEADEAAAEAKEKRDRATQKLMSSLAVAIAASGSGIADNIEGMTIGKTAAKNEWYIKPDELERGLTAVDPSKTQKKYHLADVIRLAHDKSHPYDKKDQHISKRVQAFPERQKLYARYLHDMFETHRTEANDEEAVQAACRMVQKGMKKGVDVKAAAAKKAQEELKMEENRLAAVDEMMGMGKDMMQQPDDGNKKKRSADTATAIATKKSAAAAATTDENTENDAKKPAAKKQKAAAAKKKQGLQKASSEATVVSPTTTTSGRTGSRRRNNPVSYAE